jgi:hypothetical protein
MALDVTAAVQRINDAIGFRPAGNPLEPAILRRLQEAQRDFEKGKTLPRFLLREDQTISLAQGAHVATLPADFLREDDENRLHYTPSDSNFALFLVPRRYSDAVRIMSNHVADTDPVRPVPPMLYSIRKSTIDFIVPADIAYTFTWNYYGAEPTLDAVSTNGWTENAFEWIVGEAGYRIAGDLRDGDAVQLFDKMRTMGRAAVFSDIIADEDAQGPYQMGAWL